VKQILSILGYLPRILAIFSLATIVAPCGGSPSGSPGAVSGSNGAAPTATPAVLAAAATGPVLPIPTNVVDNTTVDLQCGQIYQGTLDLTGKSNITVRTLGICGNAGITPASAITGWTLYQGNIYSAPVNFAPVQVSIAGNPIDAAHWPDGAQIWVTDGSSPPNSDLVGATLVYQEDQSFIATQTISGTTFDTTKPYYVEGKLWMLDNPGEWAVSSGRLYLWAPDGLSPEGRVWAAPNSNGINADGSANITIDGVNIFSAADGISGDTSTNLTVRHSDILNSARDGIWASGSTGLVVDRTTVTNSVRNGIDGWFSITGAVVTNSSVTNTGTVGRPKPTNAGIMFGDGTRNTIQNVRVINSGYHGISVLHNGLHNPNPTDPNAVPTPSQVLSNLVDTACVRLTDCGGIYTGATDQLPLGMRIEGNTVTNVKGTEGIAIYLDDFANGVTVTKNVMSNNTMGMQIHNGFNNEVTFNTFDSNAVTHLRLFQEGGGMIHDIKVNDNTFKSTNGEQTYSLDADTNLFTFIFFDRNTYTSSNPAVFSWIWDGLPNSLGVTHSYTEWKTLMGQDANSTMNSAP
jgi:parallel beta-helix repeat protein